MTKKITCAFLAVALSFAVSMAIEQNWQDKKVYIPDPFFIIEDLNGQKWKMVEVCPVSGLLPTEYCPRVEKRFFKYPDGLPTSFCEVHTPKLTYPAKLLRAEFNRPIYLTTYLLPALLIYKEASFEGYTRFVNTLVENDYGNTLRAFSAGIWEKDTIKKIRLPFIKKKGKFDLERMNPEWLEEFLKRIRYFVNCGGTFIYTLIDGCSMHGGDGWWKYHWWNGQNNINGTNEDSNAVRHMYNWAERGIPGAAKTKHYVLKFMMDMVRILEKEFPDSVVYDFNEFGGDAEWYLNVDRDVFQKFNIPKHRKMLSIVRPDYGEMAMIMSEYIWQPHGICSLDAYNCIYTPAAGLIQPSADGCSPPASRDQAKWIVFNSLIDNRVGFENNRYWNPDWEETEENYWKQADWNIAKGMKEGFLLWYSVYK